MKPAQHKNVAASRGQRSLEKDFLRISATCLILLIWLNYSVLSKYSRNDKQLSITKTQDGVKTSPALSISSSGKPEHGSDGSPRFVESVDGHNQETVISPSTSTTSTPSSPYAYVWIIGAIHEDSMSYVGFLWDVLISASLLRKQGSTADFWLFARLSPGSKRDTMLEEYERLLSAMGIHIKYLEKPQRESFGQLVFDKFLTINMTDYKRVMFLDADIIPLTNMDYYFHLSDPDYTATPTLLKPNFIMATRGEPCNTGMFMVEPSARIFSEYKAAVKAQREHIDKKLSKDRSGSFLRDHFDVKLGWGYDFFKNNDEWHSINRRKKQWIFYASHSDQGLMYYVARFLYKDVSIAIGRKVENWKGIEGVMKPELESEMTDVLEKYQPEILAYQYGCDNLKAAENNGFLWTCNPPYNSFAHFYGSHKPWQNKFDPESFKRKLSKKDSELKRAASIVWFKELLELNERLEMHLDFEHWNEKYVPEMKKSPLGYIAKYYDKGTTK